MSAQNYFKAIVGVDTLSVRKPDPAPFFETLRLLNGKTNRSCLVGDSITDYSTAKAADVPIILVDFPPNETDMSTLTPDAIINHFDELIPKIENLFLKLK
jgi:phosphoglycolate phosphatase